MQWIKTLSAKRWNFTHGSTDHLWGHRYFARAVKDQQEYEYIMDYIDQNPVKAGLAAEPSEWKASGAFYKLHDLQDLVDFSPIERLPYVKLLSPVPFLVSRLLPPAQLEHTLKYYGVYALALERLFGIISQMPKLGDTKTFKEPIVYLHYYTGNVDYFICEYDGQDTMYGKVYIHALPEEIAYQTISISKLLGNPLIKLDFSWKVMGIDY
jgi:hypothetical protein